MNVKNIRSFLVIVIFYLFAIPNLSSAGIELKTYTLNPSSLSKIKNEIQKGSNDYKTALSKLINEADKFLKLEIHTVVEKKQIPPSSDMHDYLSLSIYYWPDPSKKDGLPYIVRDGETNPEINSILDKTYFENMISRTFALSLAYFYTGNDSYAKKAVAYFKSWFIDKETLMNPNLNFAQIMKGKNTGNPYGIIDSRNIIHVIDSIGLLADYKPFDEESKNKIKIWFEKYLQWLLESPNGIKEAEAKNNHLVYYYSQVISIALYLDKTDIALKYINGIKDNLINIQIEPDGAQPLELKRTRALSYSVFNLTAFFTLAEQAAAMNVDLWNHQSPDGRSIKKALDYIIPYTSGEKESAYKQIVTFNNKDLYPLLLNAYYVYKDKKYLALTKKLAGNDFDGLRERLYY